MTWSPVATSPHELFAARQSAQQVLLVANPRNPGLMHLYTHQVSRQMTAVDYTIEKSSGR